MLTGPWRLLGVGLLVLNGLLGLPLLIVLLASAKTRSFALPLLLAIWVALPLTGFALLAASATAFWVLLAVAAAAWALVYRLIRPRLAGRGTPTATSP